MSSTSITDIEEVVKIWAWNVFIATRSKDLKNLKLDDVVLDVKWDKVRFLHGRPDYKEQRKLDKPNSQVVFRSTYENWTDHDQEHSFQTVRTTVSSCTTEVAKSFTKGFHLEVKLGLPDEVAGATAGFGREVNMETVDENTHEESMTWSINSTIKVPPKHTTTAELVVREQELNASFNMDVNIKGRVLVVVTNLKDNNSFVQSIEGDFSDILKKYRDDNNNKNYIIENKCVKWQLEGTCHFRFGIEQFVRLRENPLVTVDKSIEC
ncbi:hypothetical protein SNE40_016975 [Patella caerulea]|uniref:Uncharacterized protein n=1 Tax=Patella caerulea TaxID=87958 RepID=A0AAN8JCZ9_PATCE